MDQHKEWTVDLDGNAAWHSSGFGLRFEGSPGSSNFGCFPASEALRTELSHLERLTLIRDGVRAYETSYRQHRRASGSAPSQAPQRETKVTVVKRRRISSTA